MKRLKPILSCLNVAANRDVLADANVEKLISLAQGYVSVQENDQHRVMSVFRRIINTDFYLE